MVWILPGELEAGLGARLRVGAPLDMIVFPQFHSQRGGPWLERLDERAAAALLADHVEETAVSYDPFLGDWFARPDRAELDAATRLVVRTTPCFRLHQTMSTLQQGARVVRERVEALETSVAECR